jgi:cytochrome c oxidase assembly protein subunit 15
MNTIDLYNWAPALRVMGLGLLIALGPLCWVWLRHRQGNSAARLRALTLLTLFLTFDLVLFGAFTRLTDSGLGCPDWPGCYGSVTPLGAQVHIDAAQMAMPSGPVTQSKAWIEMIHRYWATGVGVLILTLTVFSWSRAKVSVSGQAWWPTFTLVWVCLQGAFGALTVTQKLSPAIVTLHLLGGMFLLALLSVQVFKVGGLVRESIPASLRIGLWVTTALVWLQISLGGWVSTNYAVLACGGFPLCNAQWWPAWEGSGFEIWRQLGYSASGQILPFSALVSIHVVHRAMAIVVALAVAGLFWRLKTVKVLERQRQWLLGLTVLQIVTGLSNVIFDWPLLAALMHTGGAAGLVVTLTWMLTRSHVKVVNSNSVDASPTPALEPTDSRPLV